MVFEIEKKFLVDVDLLTLPDEFVKIRQGYLHDGSCGRSEVRVRQKGEEGFLTLKSSTAGVRRLEFEYKIPSEDVDRIALAMCQNSIEKKRFSLNACGNEWLVDVFMGDLHGLVIAELELADEDEPFDLPEWVTKDVTADRTYYNSSLSSMKFNRENGQVKTKMYNDPHYR